MNKKAISSLELLFTLLIVSILFYAAKNVFFPAKTETEITKMQSDLRQVIGVAANAMLVKNQE